ncbi:MAG: PaaI family thioesterase [Acidimicrobiales bacterium]|nr:PaaI family thioesterase [Acidimicrobiales bacterium]
MFETEFTVAEANAIGEGRFPAEVGLRFTEVGDRLVRGELDVDPRHLAPNGFLHAGVVITLADTCCGYGVRTCPPTGANGFTTLDITTKHLGTAREGTISCVARARHAGRSTQVWEAEVTQGERVLCLFRCTQLLLYPRE